MDTLIKEYIQKNKDCLYEYLKELCLIPSPSHFEHKRAEYCKNWLIKAGTKNVYIDDALNVVFPLNCENSDKITVFAAHIDTVFPDTESMPYYDDGEKIHSPSVSDDTASVIVLLLMAKFFIENNLKPENGIIFVCNSCEEGLGNLKGTKQLFNDYSGKIKQFITFDSSLHQIADRCVGSHRYEVEVKTIGGHSYGNFGRENAINKLAEIITEIYKIKVPEKEGCRTTYNVGTIEGGTTINTIAPNAKMLCEYRSDDKECLDIMQEKFTEIFSNFKSNEAELTVTLVGDRPCSSIDTEKIDELKQVIVPVIENIIDKKVIFESSSTDCNVPLSLGVPALCVGVSYHGGVHTREEWVDKASIITGLEVALKLGIKLTL